MASQQRFKHLSSCQFPGYESISGINDIYAANSRHMNDWVTHCKSLLIKMECTNIGTRSNHWSSIVNTQTHHTNHRLSITQSLSRYKYICDPLHHLSFLSDWKGLKMRQITNYPRTYTEFEAKAKNWLNGRRAPNYGATLFPDMIKTAETYAHCLAEQVFGEENDLFEPYFSVLMYAYLAALCSERITMNNASKRTPLLLENSLKYCKTPTAKMLQTYAQDYPYPHQFPSHLRQAADFFHSKYDEYMQRIYIKQNGSTSCVNYSNNKLIINELKMKRDTSKVSETASHSDTSSASAITPCNTASIQEKMVQLSSNQYTQLLAKIESLEHTQLQQRKVIACLAGKLQILEDKNKVYHVIPPIIPPIPPLHCQIQSDDNNVMPTIGADINNNNNNNNLGFGMDFTSFTQFDNII